MRFNSFEDLINYLRKSNQKFKIKYYPKSRTPREVFTYGKTYYYSSELKIWTQ